MRVEMPSGAWAELRDKLQAGDKFATQSGFTVEWQDGKQLMPSGVSNTMMKNLLGVAHHHLGRPRPGRHPCPVAELRRPGHPRHARH